MIVHKLKLELIRAPKYTRSWHSWARSAFIYGIIAIDQRRIWHQLKRLNRRIKEFDLIQCVYQGIKEYAAIQLPHCV